MLLVAVTIFGLANSSTAKATAILESYSTAEAATAKATHD